MALVDDGVDASHWRLNESIKEGITYRTSTQGQTYIASSYYASATGHGTLMATLICTVCPFVDLYIAKLDDKGASEGSAFTAKSAAQVRDTNTFYVLFL